MGIENTDALKGEQVQDPAPTKNGEELESVADSNEVTQILEQEGEAPDAGEDGDPVPDEVEALAENDDAELVTDEVDGPDPSDQEVPAT